MEDLNTEQLKAKWGGSLPQVGDWVGKPDNLEAQECPDYLQILVDDPAEALLLIIGAWMSCDPIPLTREVFESIAEGEFVIVRVNPEDGLMGGIPIEFDSIPYHDFTYINILFRYGEDSLNLDLHEEIPLSEIKYLHQLQQLYRLLTGGKELTIEL